MGVDVLVIDTAHGHQERTLRTVEAVRSVAPDSPIVAGNVVTAPAPANSSRPAPTSSRSASGRERCARLG